MAASKLSSTVAVAAAAAAAVASLSSFSDRTYADGSFRFNPFSSSSSSSSSSHSSSQRQADHSSNEKAEADEPRGAGFDPEALERGAKALREINSSPYAKQVLLLILVFLSAIFNCSENRRNGNNPEFFLLDFLLFHVKHMHTSLGLTMLNKMSPTRETRACNLILFIVCLWSNGNVFNFFFMGNAVFRFLM